MKPGCVLLAGTSVRANEKQIKMLRISDGIFFHRKEADPQGVWAVE